MTHKLRRPKAKSKAKMKPKLLRGGKRYSAGEIFMAALGAALVILFAVLVLLGMFD